MSPADLRIENKSGTGIDLEISISRFGYEVFQKEVALGLLESRGFGASVDPEDRSRRVLENAIPIGCGLPEDVRVEIETDDGRTVDETVRFPAPDPPSGGGVGSSELRITVFDSEIELDGDNWYWVV